MKINTFLLLIVLCALGSCAKQRPPSGGPVDKIPPEIVSVFPAPNSTQVKSNIKIMIEFTWLLDLLCPASRYRLDREAKCHNPLSNFLAMDHTSERRFLLQLYHLR